MSQGQCLIWMSHVAGSMLGGYIMDTRGSIFLYRAAAALSFVTLVCVVKIVQNITICLPASHTEPSLLFSLFLFLTLSLALSLPYSFCLYFSLARSPMRTRSLSTTQCVYLAVTLNYNGSASLFEKRKALNTLLKPLEPQPTLQHTATHTTTNSNTPLEPQPDQAPELRQE